MSREELWAAAYPRGVGRALEPPAGTLGGLLSDTARRRGGRAAFSCHGVTWTYEETLAAARSVAAGLAAVTAPGDRILLRSPSDTGFVAAAFGCYLSGRVLVPVAPDLPSAAVDEVARFVGARLRLDTARDAAATATGCAPPPCTRPEDDAVLQLTSGTTGARKAARMSHRNLLANALQNDRWFGWGEHDVVLGALPLHHTWGLSCVLHAGVLCGARVVLVPRFDAQEVVETIRRERVTVAYGSATMFHRLLDAAGTRASDAFASLRYVKAGAMLVGGDLVARWRAAVPEVPMVLGYGLTEASPEVCGNPLHAPRAGTVGVPLPGTDLRLADPGDPDRDAGAGPGELLVRGPQVTAGYWGDEAATAASLLPGGWLRTGDVARFDERGYVVIVDRLKDLVKFRGVSIAPGVVEAALRRHPAVVDAVVVGAPHPVDGEVPVAFVETSAEVPEEELAALAAEHLTPPERPRRFVRIDAIPRNAVGKPLRRVLRDRVRA